MASKVKGFRTKTVALPPPTGALRSFDGFDSDSRKTQVLYNILSQSQLTSNMECLTLTIGFDRLLESLNRLSTFLARETQLNCALPVWTIVSRLERNGREMSMHDPASGQRSGGTIIHSGWQAFDRGVLSKL